MAAVTDKFDSEHALKLAGKLANSAGALLSARGFEMLSECAELMRENLDAYNLYIFSHPKRPM